MILRLKFFGELEFVDEHTASQIMEDAIRESINPFRPQSPMPMYRSYKDRKGLFFLELVRSKRTDEQEQILTYGLWITTFRGIKTIMEHHPTLWFAFGIRVNKLDDKDRTVEIGFRGFANTIR